MAEITADMTTKQRNYLKNFMKVVDQIHLKNKQEIAKEA